MIPGTCHWNKNILRWWLSTLLVLDRFIRNEWSIIWLSCACFFILKGSIIWLTCLPFKYWKDSPTSYEHSFIYWVSFTLTFSPNDSFKQEYLFICYVCQTNFSKHIWTFLFQVFLNDSKRNARTYVKIAKLVYLL